VHSADEVAQVVVGPHGGRTGPHGIDDAGFVVARQRDMTQDARHDASARGDEQAILAG